MLFAEGDAGSGLFGQVTLVALGAIVSGGSLLLSRWFDLRRQRESERHQRQVEYAKWARENLQRVFAAVCKQMVASKLLKENGSLTAFDEASADLGYLDDDGHLYALACEVHNRVADGLHALAEAEGSGCDYEQHSAIFGEYICKISEATSTLRKAMRAALHGEVVKGPTTSATPSPLRIGAGVNGQPV